MNQYYNIPKGKQDTQGASMRVRLYGTYSEYITWTLQALHVANPKEQAR